MKWWLSVFFYVNGTWVPGADIEGWSPRVFPSESECISRKAFAEKECHDHPLDYDTAWVCSEGRPVYKLKLPSPPIEC